MSHACPLCRTSRTEPHFSDGRRDYFHCPACDLVFLHPAQRPGPKVEARRYVLHENDPADPGYLQHLRRLADPVAERVPAGSRGLDFGCGPAPVLADILRARGFTMMSYDPQFFPDRSVLDATWDFVTCSEVIEHVHDPGALLDLFDRILRAGGTLAVMTRLHDGVSFDSWWYRRDVTHVCFYSSQTMRWIADARGWRLDLVASPVVLFTTGTHQGRSRWDSTEPEPGAGRSRRA